MKSGKHWKIVSLLLLILMLFIISESFAGDTVTVVTYSGKYEDVTYKFNRADKQLILIQPDWQTEIDISDIRFIFNKEGVDITDMVLGNEPEVPDTIPTVPIDSLVKTETPPLDIGKITIITSSKKYDNVEYRADTTNKILVVIQDGWESKIEYADIEAIYDNNQRDITSIILEAKTLIAADSTGATEPSNNTLKPPRQKKQETWLSENSSVIQNARKKQWEIGLSVTALYTVPAGKYYDGIDAGIGIEGAMHIILNYETAIRIGVSRAGLKDGNEYYLYSIDPRYTVVDQDVSFLAMRYNIGGEYYRSFNKKKRDLNIWYAYSSIGVITHKMTAKGNMRNNSSGLLSPFNLSTKESKFEIIFGAGVVKSIQKNFGLEVSGSCDIVFLAKNPDREDSLFEDDIEYAYIFDLKVGLIGLF